MKPASSSTSSADPQGARQTTVTLFSIQPRACESETLASARIPDRTCEAVDEAARTEGLRFSPQPQEARQDRTKAMVGYDLALSFGPWSAAPASGRPEP